MLFFFLFMVFVLGTIVGSLLNVCIYRLPLEKSILWPGSHCGNCLQPVRWYDNIPLVSYWLLRGRCRTCKAKFSIRYFMVELFTGLCFAGIFGIEIVADVHQMGTLAGIWGPGWVFFPTWQAWVFFAYHAILVSFLIVASVCDLDHREIPLSVTISGTLVGLIGAIILAWPWPYDPPRLAYQALGDQPWWSVSPSLGPRIALYPWPFWGPLPSWCGAGGNWQTGLLTGVIGAAVGTLLMRLIRFVFTLGMGIEALGLGDADLMMMAGSFLGWQPVVAGFFIGVFVGLFFGIAQLALRGDNMMPFGPSLAVGTVVAFLGWHWIGPYFHRLFFDGTMMLFIGVVGIILMLGSSFVLGLLRKLRS